MKICGVAITNQVRIAMMGVAVSVESKIGRRLSDGELDSVIVEFVRQMAEREAKATVH